MLLDPAAVAVVNGTVVDEARAEVELGVCLLVEALAWAVEFAAGVEVLCVVELCVAVGVVNDPVLVEPEAVLVIGAVKVRTVCVAGTAAAIPSQME